MVEKSVVFSYIYNCLTYALILLEHINMLPIIIGTRQLIVHIELLASEIAKILVENRPMMSDAYDVRTIRSEIAKEGVIDMRRYIEGMDRKACESERSMPKSLRAKKNWKEKTMYLASVIRISLWNCLRVSSDMALIIVFNQEGVLFVLLSLCAISGRVQKVMKSIMITTNTICVYVLECCIWKLLCLMSKAREIMPVRAMTIVCIQLPIYPMIVAGTLVWAGMYSVRTGKSPILLGVDSPPTIPIRTLLIASGIEMTCMDLISVFHLKASRRMFRGRRSMMKSRYIENVVRP